MGTGNTVRVILIKNRKKVVPLVKKQSNLSLFLFIVGAILLGLYFMPNSKDFAKNYGISKMESQRSLTEEFPNKK